MKFQGMQMFLQEWNFIDFACVFKVAPRLQQRLSTWSLKFEGQAKFPPLFNGTLVHDSFIFLPTNF